MITAPVTQEQLLKWKRLWEKHVSSMKPNRISGTALCAYFTEKYAPEIVDNPEFSEALRQNVTEQFGGYADLSGIVCCRTDTGVYVGIDTNTGFFQVESEDIAACIPIFDDLYRKRGLSSDDLRNYVVTGQYLEMMQQQ